MNDSKPLGLKILSLLFFILPVFSSWYLFTSIRELMSPPGGSIVPAPIPMTFYEIILKMGVFIFIIAIVAIIIPLFVSFGLLKTKKWARTLAIVYGIFSLIPSGGGLFTVIIFLIGPFGIFLMKPSITAILLILIPTLIPIGWSLAVLILCFNKNISSLFKKKQNS